MFSMARSNTFMFQEDPFAKNALIIATIMQEALLQMQT